MYFIFPPHLTCASALPGETRNPKSASFHLNRACSLPKRWNTLKYHLVTAELPFTVKTIAWMHQTGPRILQSVTHMLYVSRCRSLCKRWELFFVKPEWKSTDSINGISYYLNKCRRYQTHHRWQGRQHTGALCIQHRPTAAALSTITEFEWKMWFSCFPVLPGSAEAQVIWGGILKHLLIAYFIRNISAKKYQNLFMCVKVIASHRWDVFWDMV